MLSEYNRESNKQFRELAYEAHTEYSSNVLKRAAAKSLYVGELRKRLKAFLTECHKAGYTQIVIGDGEEAVKLWGPRPCGNMVFAIPSDTRKGNDFGLALWELTYILGGSSCGNGLSKADQSQLSMDSKCFRPIHGVYNLPEDINKF